MACTHVENNYGLYIYTCRTYFLHDNLIGIYMYLVRGGTVSTYVKIIMLPAYVVCSYYAYSTPDDCSKNVILMATVPFSTDIPHKF